MILGLCICTLALYAADGSFSGNTLFTLLRLVQFFTGFLVILSLCSLVFNIWRLVKSPRIKYAVFTVLYLLSGIFGTVLMFSCGFIIVATGGNL